MGPQPDGIDGQKPQEPLREVKETICGIDIWSKKWLYLYRPLVFNHNVK